VTSTDITIAAFRPVSR